eukprot:3403298-Prymnesium_polylepis.1
MEQGVEQRVGAAIFIHVGETSIRVADDDQFADRAFGDTAERWRVVESHLPTCVEQTWSSERAWHGPWQAMQLEPADGYDGTTRAVVGRPTRPCVTEWGRVTHIAAAHVRCGAHTAESGMESGESGGHTIALALQECRQSVDASGQATPAPQVIHSEVADTVDSLSLRSGLYCTTSQTAMHMHMHMDRDPVFGTRTMGQGWGWGCSQESCIGHYVQLGLKLSVSCHKRVFIRT